MEFSLNDADRHYLCQLRKATKEKKYGAGSRSFYCWTKVILQHEIADILMIDEDMVINWKQQFFESPSIEHFRLGSCPYETTPLSLLLCLGCENPGLEFIESYHHLKWWQVFLDNCF